MPMHSHCTDLVQSPVKLSNLPHHFVSIVTGTTEQLVLFLGNEHGVGHKQLHIRTGMVHCKNRENNRVCTHTQDILYSNTIGTQCHVIMAGCQH